MYTVSYSLIQFRTKKLLLLDLFMSLLLHLFISVYQMRWNVDIWYYCRRLFNLLASVKKNVIYPPLLIFIWYLIQMTEGNGLQLLICLILALLSWSVYPYNYSGYPWVYMFTSLCMTQGVIRIKTSEPCFCGISLANESMIIKWYLVVLGCQPLIRWSSTLFFF